MHPFKIVRPTTDQQAIAIMDGGTSKFIGGGTNLVDLMKMNIEKPELLVDINALELKKIETTANGNMLIGALVKNTALAYHPTISNAYPLLSEAILAGASAQLRNMASTAGNIMQRTRCPYFYDTVTPCNKRTPGSGCAAIKGYNRMHAVLGTSPGCVATHPSDMCVALAALDAIIHVQGAGGQRLVPFADFHLLPADTPNKEHSLGPGELITHIELPALPFAKHSAYLKIRDRSSYEFALVSAAVALNINNGIIKDARISLGGVGTKPWRASTAERLLTGKKAASDSYQAAAEEAMKDAKPLKDNGFKIELAKRTIVAALEKIKPA
jgi:xanthine dehydrogenase YagS FAD-binding subunit